MGVEMKLTANMRLFATFLMLLCPEPDLAAELPDELANALICREEWEAEERDCRGNLDFQHNSLFWSGRYQEPVINQWLMDKAGGAALTASPWPQGKKFAVCLTHDADVVSYASPIRRLRQMRGIVRQVLKGEIEVVGKYNVVSLLSILKKFSKLFGRKEGVVPHPQRGNDLFAPWIKLESRYGFRSTFFFLPEESLSYHPFDGPMYKYDDRIEYEGERITVAELMRELERGGWEVGLHGSFLSFDDAQELKRQKDRLERAVQREVMSIRQHYLHFDIRKTPKAQSEAGFKYDSTFGSNRIIGFRNGLAFPFYFYDLVADAPLPVLEIPLNIQDGALFAPDNLDLTPSLALMRCKLLIDRVEEAGGLVTLLWHPACVDAGRFPGWFGVYEELLSYIAQKDAWVAPVREIGNWWEQRRREKLSGQKVRLST
jgi:peptidoglycan/xylan/chitin deacetylase (PgdA/CDA1 family)